MTTEQFDTECKMIPERFKDEISPEKIKWTGTDAQLKWALFGVIVDGKLLSHLGEVSCPCTIDGRALGENEALRAILGQLAAMGMPDKW